MESGPSTWAMAAAGGLLILWALRDIWHTVFRQMAGGRVGGLLVHLIWRAFRALARGKSSRLHGAGPVGVVVGVASWVLALAVGWSLIYLPFLPDGFAFASALDPQERQGFGTALYFSFVTMATLGYGDVVPVHLGLRVATALEAFTGFVVLTATLSWVRAIPSVLTQRRVVARRLALLARELPEPPFGEVETLLLCGQLEAITADLLVTRANLVEYPVTYFFHDQEPESALPEQLPILLHLLAGLQHPEEPGVIRLRRTALREALDQLAAALGSTFLGLDAKAETTSVLARYRDDHLRGGGKRASA